MGKIVKGKSTTDKIDEEGQGGKGKHNSGHRRVAQMEGISKRAGVVLGN